MKISVADIVLNIKRKLPEPIKEPFRWFYYKLTMDIDRENIELLKEYYNLDQENVMRLLEISGRLNADFWYCLNPKTEEDIIKFYEQTPFYVFNLIFWHSTKYQKKMRLRFVELAKGNVLDYGGGAGGLCVKIAKKGLNVDYADIQGRTFNFAKWLFQKKNYDIGVINLSTDKLLKRYNTIFCIDVVEHVKNPERLLKSLVEHLEKNGILIVTALHPCKSKKLPMHFDTEIDMEKYLKSLGMEESDEPFLWVKKA